MDLENSVTLKDPILTGAVGAITIPSAMRPNAELLYLRT
jgi:hypothetical protein